MKTLPSEEHVLRTENISENALSDLAELSYPACGSKTYISGESALSISITAILKTSGSATENTKKNSRKMLLL